jgi:hypothetical protein
MGGKPSKGTSADRRLKENRGGGAKKGTAKKAHASVSRPSRSTEVAPSLVGSVRRV